MPQRAFALAAILLILLAGCGGNSGGGSNPSQVPTLSSISPTSANAGSFEINLIASGSNFLDGAVVEWNGSPLTTTWVASTQLSAIIPVADLTAAGSGRVSVVNPSPGGGTSSALKFTIFSAAADSTLVRQVSGIGTPQDIVWDGTHGILYISVGSGDAIIPNTLVAVNPVAGTAGAPVPAGNNPDPLALSSDAAYLWVGLDGDSAVQRFLLPGLTKDIYVPMPKDSSGNTQQAYSIQGAPGSPHTIALIVGQDALASEQGVYVYDDGTQRPNFVPGRLAGGPQINWIQWGSSDSTVWGSGLQLNVTSSGITWNGQNGVPLGLYNHFQFDAQNDLLYAYQLAYDPIEVSQVGWFDLPAGSGSEACTADSALGRYYCVEIYSPTGSDNLVVELWVLDLGTYALIDRVYFGWLDGEAPNQTHSPITGLPIKLVRWGNSGLALMTLLDAGFGNAGVFLIDGPAINPNGGLDSSAGTSAPTYTSMTSLSPQSAAAGTAEATLTITGSNFTPQSSVCWSCNFIQLRTVPTTYVSPTKLTATLPAAALSSPATLPISVYDPTANLFGTNSLAFTVSSPSGSTQVTPLNLDGIAMASDATTGMLYVGVSDLDGAYPNSVVVLNPATGAVTQSRTVSPDPDLISDGADGQYLYVAFANATSMTQFQLPALSSPLTWALNNSSDSGPYIAGDMKAAPVSPHTTAVTLFLQNTSPAATGGVVIYDDEIARPQVAPGFLNSGNEYDYLAWGGTDSILAAASQPLYAMEVNSSGVQLLAAGNSTFNDSGGELHSDFGTGLVYSDNGNVGDPTTGLLVGSYAASGLVAPDSSINRVFILGQTGAQAETNDYTVQSFNQQTYALVSSITLNNLFGYPTELVRAGTSGLAVLTTNDNFTGYSGPPGMLYLVQDSSFVSDALPSNSNPSKNVERVRHLWSPAPKVERQRRMWQRRPAAPD